jgi:hypothetical protein
LTAQRIDLRPFGKSLREYFTKLPKLEKFVDLPNAFSVRDEFRRAVAILTQAAKDIFVCISQGGYLSSWLTNVVVFPRAVATAFGFTNVHFVIDHFEVADVDIVPSAPFGDTVTASLIEYFKFMISGSSYAIACADEQHFLECLGDTTDDAIDLRGVTDVISVVDSDPGHSNRYAFNLTVEEEQLPFMFTVQACGGCPGYTLAWDELVQLGERVKNEEKKNTEAKIAKELRLLLLKKIRDLCNIVLYRFDARQGIAVPNKKKITGFVIVDTSAEIEMPIDPSAEAESSSA